MEDLSTVGLNPVGGSKETRIFYAMSFVSSLMSGVMGSLMLVYMLSIGFSPWQIGTILAVQQIAMVLFEFPTGIFADRYGRKRSIVVAFLLSGLAAIGWFFSVNFAQWLIFAILFGIAYTFQSGAKESLMLDVMKAADDDKKRNKVYVRVGIWGNIGFVIGALLAAGLALVWLKSIWIVVAICNVTLILITVVGIKYSEKIGATGLSWRQSLYDAVSIGRNALRAVSASPQLVKMIGVAILFSLAIAVYGLAYPIYLKQTLELPNYMFGLLGAIFGLVGVVGMLLGDKLSKYRDSMFALRVFVISIAILLMVLGILKTVAVVLMVLVGAEMLIYGWYPIYQSMFNKYVPNAVRASVLSLQSIAILLATAGGQGISGWLIQITSSQQVMIYSGIVLLPILLLLAGKVVPKRAAQ